MPGGLLGSGTPGNSNTNIIIGVSGGILAIGLITVAYFLTRHIRRGAKGNAHTDPSIHDAFRLESVGGSRHPHGRCRWLRLQKDDKDQSISAELARQGLPRPQPSLTTDSTRYPPGRLATTLR